MAAIAGRTIFHADGTEEDVPLIRLKADQVKYLEPVPLAEPEPLELDISDWIDEEEAEEERLSLYELPDMVGDQRKKIAALEATIERLSFKLEKQSETMAKLTMMEYRLSQVDFSKLPQNEAHPDVKAARARKDSLEQMRKRQAGQAERNSFDNVWRKFR